MSWQLAVPDGVIARAVTPPPDSPYATMTIHRGWLEGDAPTTFVVTTQHDRSTHLSDHVRRLTRGFRMGETAGEPVDVEGARGARRADGLSFAEEGLSPEPGDEAVTVVVARGRGDEVVLLAVRTRPEDGVQAAVDALVASLKLGG